MTKSLLFSPLELRGMRLRNRIVVSPMCQYTANVGRPVDWHQVHYGQLAVGGAGLVMLEATAIEARGRISHGDLGLWSDDQVASHARLVDLIRGGGAQPAVQLAHAGRKGSVHRPWDGGTPINDGNARPGEAPWQCVAPSALELLRLLARSQAGLGHFLHTQAARCVKRTGFNLWRRDILGLCV